RKIIDVHFPGLSGALADGAIEAFYRLRQLEGIEKRPATRELINWLRALQSDPDFNPKRLLKEDLPFLGVLFKKSQDFEQASRLVQRRARY
ncbi:MAG: MoxR family ATPase, partial [Desulfatitalea sp.]